MEDIFRKTYEPLHEERQKLVDKMKEAAEKLFNLFEYINDREMSLAKTNLEQSIMWAVKSVAKKSSEPVQGEPQSN